jgi:hypothetical protein
MPRKMCIHAQNSGHALEPMVAFKLWKFPFFSNFASNSSFSLFDPV